MPTSPRDRLCVDTLRFLAVDMVEAARSGHPGLPLGAAPAVYALWDRFLKFDPAAPDWCDRDRFVLSAGHGSALLYALLHVYGHDLPLDELRRFRQWGSRTPGHPEHGLTPGVEATTGPLGQGLGNAVGMAIAEAHLAARFNRPGHEIVDHRTWVLASDGDLMEGISSEAGSLAGHLRLGKLKVIYDDNGITIDGPTSLTFDEDRCARFAAFGWHVLRVPDGDDVEAVAAALAEAAAEGERPTLIAVRTRIGRGSPGKEGTAAAHGEPLGPEEARRTREALGWPPEPPFHVPGEAREHFRAAAARGAESHRRWRERLAAYRRAHPEAAAELERRLAGELPPDWDAGLPACGPADPPQATRAAAGKALAALARRVPELVGGSADLAPSNLTLIEGGDFAAGNRAGRNLRFGVREHAMGAALNGIALHGGLRPYGGTFLIFSDYMRPPIRLAALGRLPVVYVFTHDSLGLGEDGPTHQPVEHLLALRAIPGLVVIRPADAAEAVAAWPLALAWREGPVALVLTRQKVPPLVRAPGLDPAAALARGAYVLADADGDGPGDGPDVLLAASGSEVQLAVAARELLRPRGLRAWVVSVPSWELFLRQPESYRLEVLPPAVPLVAVEAGNPLGWRTYGGGGAEVVGVERFGASAPGEVLMREYGLTAEAVAARALARVAGRQGETGSRG